MTVPFIVPTKHTEILLSCREASPEHGPPRRSWIQSRPQDELVGSAGELAALRGREGRPEQRTTTATEPAARPLSPGAVNGEPS
ncbi:unnamed protein product [Arctogadus glacialis]